MAEWIWDGIEALRVQLEPVINRNLPILLLGEPGTGKTELARWIHRNSKRRDKPYLSISIPNIPDLMAESELFGHERGAFTGADRAKKGLFRTADGGTVFIDEIGEATPAMQAKLLGVLNNGSIRPLGWDKPDEIQVDVRLIFATNRNLREMVTAKLFREDLRSRLVPPVFCLPPLRERPESIVKIFEHWLQRAWQDAASGALPSLSNELRLDLTRRAWAGNGREVRKVAELLAVFKKDTEPFSSVDLMRLPLGDEWPEPSAPGPLGGGAVDVKGNGNVAMDAPLPTVALHAVVADVAYLCSTAGFSDEHDKTLVREMALRIVSQPDWQDAGSSACGAARLQLFKKLQMSDAFPLRRQLQVALAAVVRWDAARREQSMNRTLLIKEFCRTVTKTGEEPAFLRPMMGWLLPTETGPMLDAGRPDRRRRRGQ